MAYGCLLVGGSFLNSTKLFLGLKDFKQLSNIDTMQKKIKGKYLGIVWLTNYM